MEGEAVSDKTMRRAKALVKALETSDTPEKLKDVLRAMGNRATVTRPDSPQELRKVVVEVDWGHGPCVYYLIRSGPWGWSGGVIDSDDYQIHAAILAVWGVWRD